MGNTIKQISSIRHKVSDTEIEQIILGAHAGIYTNYGILLSHNTEFPASSITENPKPSPYLGFIAACEHGSIKGNYQTVLGQYNVKRTEEHILQVGNGTNENNRKDALIAGKHGVCVSELRVGKYASGADGYNGEPTVTDIHPPENGNILPAYRSLVSTILGSQSILGHLTTYGDIVSYGKISFRTWAGDENHDYYNTCYLQMMHGATSSSSGTYGMVPAPSASAEPLFLNNRGEWSKPASATLPELIGSSIGSNNKPIYWNGSSFQTIGYTIDASVPSDAQFTDTIYTLPIATNTTLGGVKVPGNGVVIEAGGNLAASLNSVTKNSNLVDLPFEILAELPERNDITYRISGPYDSESTCNKYNMYEPGEASEQVCFTYYTSMINYSELTRDSTTGKYHLPQGTKIYLATSSPIPDNVISCLQLFENEVVVYQQGGNARGESIFDHKRANGPTTSSEFTMDKDYHFDKIGAAIQLRKKEGNPFAANFALIVQPKKSLKAGTYPVFRISETGIACVLNKDRELNKIIINDQDYINMTR